MTLKKRVFTKDGEFAVELETELIDVGTERRMVWCSSCPELGTATCGDTEGEAIRNIKEAIEVQLDAMRELGRRIEGDLPDG